MPALSERPDVEDVHAGLEAFLRADPILASLAPGGVWFGVLPQTVSDIAVLIRLQHGDNVGTHDRAGYEVLRYSIVAVGESETGNPGRAVTAAAKRVRRVLEGQPFHAEGYGPVTCELDETFGPIADVEWDGARYRAMRGRVWQAIAAPLVGAD